MPTVRRETNLLTVGRFLAGPVLAAMLLGPLPAQSQVPVFNLGLYHEMRADIRRGKPDAKAEMYIFLGGLLDGMRAVEAASIAAGKKPSVCVPQGFDLQPVHLMEALDKLLASNRKFHEDTTSGLGFYAKLAMGERFPCAD